MGVDAGVEIAGLRHRRADPPVGFDPMNGEVARRVVGRQQKSAAAVDAGVDRTRRQCRRLAMRPQRSRRGIDGERAGVVLVAGNPGSAATRDDIQKTPRRMRPGILDIGRQRHHLARGQAGTVDVEIVARQHRSDAGVIDGLRHGRLNFRDGAFDAAKDGAANIPRRKMSGKLTGVWRTMARAKIYACARFSNRPTSASIRAMVRKLAGVMSRSGIFIANSASTASIRLTVSSDDNPASLKSVSRSSARSSPRLARIWRTSAGDAVRRRRMSAIQHGEFFPNLNAKIGGFPKPSSHGWLTGWLARHRFSIGNLYAKEPR